MSKNRKTPPEGRYVIRQKYGEWKPTSFPGEFKRSRTIFYSDGSTRLMSEYMMNPLLPHKVVESDEIKP
jgi:hypothetical protein